jgi:hypothetical protein
MLVDGDMLEYGTQIMSMMMKLTGASELWFCGSVGSLTLGSLGHQAHCARCLVLLEGCAQGRAGKVRLNYAFADPTLGVAPWKHDHCRALRPWATSATAERVWVMARMTTATRGETSGVEKRRRKRSEGLWRRLVQASLSQDQRQGSYIRAAHHRGTRRVPGMEKRWRDGGMSDGRPRPCSTHSRITHHRMRPWDSQSSTRVNPALS